MDHVLLTGMTGMVGHYLLRDLQQAGQTLAVLVRPSDRQTAEQRLDAALRYWANQGYTNLPQPRVLEGDLRCDSLGPLPRDRGWLTEHCRTIIHSAASVTFHDVAEAEVRQTNIDGTRRLLDLCETCRVLDFHYVSTAYVCGTRSGRILESELD